MYLKSIHDLIQAIKILNMIKVFGKPIRVNKASTDKKTQDVGANLFIGNLDPDVDEKVKGSLDITYVSICMKCS
jgi:splicing factor 3B subunit 4